MITLWIGVACCVWSTYWLCRYSMGFHTLVIHLRRSKMLAKPFSPAVTGWGHGQSELLSSFLSSASLCLCWHQPWPHWFLSLRRVQNHLNKKLPDIFIKCISSLLLETSTNSCYGCKCIWIPDFLLFRGKMLTICSYTQGSVHTGFLCKQGPH